MTAAQHCLMTIHGEWTGSWAPEVAQLGIRFTFEDANALPTKGSVYTPNALMGDVVADSGTATGTTGTLTRMWQSRVGGIGSVWNFGASEMCNTADDAYSFCSAMSHYQASGFRWTHVKFHAVGADGHAPLVDGSPAGAAVYTFTSPIAGDNSTYYPPELALALSLRAPIAGRRGRGRMYMPAVGGAASDGSGRVGSSAITALNAALVSFVHGIETITAWTDWKPTVCITSPGRATVVRPSQVRIGSMFDMQKRRQDALPEIYTSSAL